MVAWECRGLRPLVIGQGQCEDKAGDGEDGEDGNVNGGVGLGCGVVRGVCSHGWFGRVADGVWFVGVGVCQHGLPLLGCVGRGIRGLGWCGRSHWEVGVRLDWLV